MNAPTAAKPQTLALQRLYHWERHAPDRVAFTQPMGGGRLRELRWAEAAGEARRMAAHLASLNLPPRSQIGPIGSRKGPPARRATNPSGIPSPVSISATPTRLRSNHRRTILQGGQTCAEMPSLRPHCIA